MKITILGSAGQVGAYLTQYLKAKGHTVVEFDVANACLLYTSPSPRDKRQSRMPSSA